MSKQVKALAAQSNELCSYPQDHKVGENKLPQIVLTSIYVPSYKSIHTHGWEEYTNGKQTNKYNIQS